MAQAIKLNELDNDFSSGSHRESFSSAASLEDDSSDGSSDGSNCCEEVDSAVAEIVAELVDTSKVIPLSESIPYSVLMSVYAKDNPSFFDIALQSILNQSLPPDELVVVCDGPVGEGIDDVIARYVQLNAVKLVVIRQEVNQGLGISLQNGLGYCSNEIIVRMDSDDVSRPDRCEHQVKRMVDEDLDLLGGFIEEFNQEPGDLGSIRALPLTREDIVRYSKKRNPFNHVAVAFRKSAVLAAGGYQHFRYLEDYYLWTRMITNGCKCANMAETLVDVRVGSGMYERRSNMLYLKSEIRFFNMLYKSGYIKGLDLIQTVSARCLVTLLPSSAVKGIYNKILRS